MRIFRTSVPFKFNMANNNRDMGRKADQDSSPHDRNPADADTYLRNCDDNKPERERGRHDARDDRDHGRGRGRNDRDDDDGHGKGRSDHDDDDGDGRDRGRSDRDCEDDEDEGGVKGGNDGDDDIDPEGGDDDCGCADLTPTDEFGEPVITNRIGTEGNDALIGDCTNDNMVGSWGNDTLVGGGGDDGLSGNWGTDILTGGCGADMFVFDGNFDTDIVTDFSLEDGDHFKFVIYPAQGINPTAEDLLALATQVGDDVIFFLPDSDEAAIIQNTDLADITLDLITVEFIPATDDLIA